MNDLIQTGFDYAALPVDSADRLRTWKIEIAAFTDTVESSLVQIGLRFQKARDELSRHGVKWEGFIDWIESETKYSYSFAYNLINVAEKFKDKPFPKFGKSVLYALSAPSTPETVVQQAIEKAESGEKVTVDWVKERKQIEAQLEYERQRREAAEQRSKEWNEQYIKERDEKLAAEQKVLTLESQPKPEPEVIEKEVVPADYESAKQQVATLQAQTEALQTQTAILKKELENLQTQQAKLVSDQVKTKLQGYQNEVDDMDRKKSIMQEQVDRMKEYMASLNSESKRLEVHQDVIEKSRLHLISLAAFLSDSDEMNDKDTRDRWLRLSNMHNDAHKAILNYLGLCSSSDRLVV